VEVVYGEVKRIHVDDNIINEDGKLDIAKIKPLARLGYYDYTFVDKVFEMRIPGASEKAIDGLEGKS
jgi:flavin reductase (DIM6/NTAB) family NADH-FMN oxidoreductase RutF